MSNSPSDLNDLAEVAAEAFAATQTATLRVLEAEMHALAQMFPGGEHPVEPPLPTEEEVEEGFDNMPV